MLLVDEKCIWCGMCVNESDSLFKIWDDWLSHAIKQPENQEEIDHANNAVNICPVGAIHND